MAKKKGGGGPQKTCPACGKSVHAATRTCECSHVFQPKAVKKAKVTAAAGGADMDKLAMEFVLFNQAGNLDKAIKAVDGYKEDSLAQFVSACGGAEKAKRLLEGLAAKAAK